MITRLNIATVTTDTQQIEKARVEILENDDGTATVNVFSRRDALIASTTGQLEELDRTMWRIGAWSITRAGGCGCGGTTIKTIIQPQEA